MARNLIGTGADQVSVNGMLGELAFQSKENINFTGGTGTLSKLTVDAISAQLGVSAIDVFVYDTRKDSDGGAWRKRCQNTSWYNETLNTSTRGSRRDFPAVAVIVITGPYAIIYDGDDSSLPMWMIFTGGGATMFTNGAANNTCVWASNGILSVGSTGAIWNAYFVSDRGELRNNAYLYNFVGGGIANRNVAAGYQTVSSSGAIANSAVNDITMTVLPNAPIDSATGLPTPTIAIATDGGTSVVRHDGSVCNSVSTTKVMSVSIKDTLLIIGARFYSEPYFRYIDLTSVGASFSPANYPYVFPRITAGLNPDQMYVTSAGSNIAIKHDNDNHYLGLVNFNLSSPSNSLWAVVSNKYNSGWLSGDNKVAMLSDTTQETAVGTNYVTNGTFDTNTSGWSSDGATISVSGGQLVVTNSGTGNGEAYQAVSGLIVGKPYVFSVDITTGTSTGSWYLSNAAPNAYTGGYGYEAGAGITGTRSQLFYPTQSTVYIRLENYSNTASGAYSYYDNVSIRPADVDRSSTYKGAQIFGNITKTPVAAGADLVAYSGFSTSNFIQQPYNSSLDFGTGDFSVSCWVKSDSSGTYNETKYIFERSSVSDTNNMRIEAGLTSPTILKVWVNGGNGIAGNAFAIPADTWFKFDLVRRSGIVSVYVNGVLQASQSNPYNMVDTAARLVIGARAYFEPKQQPMVGSLALFRMSATAPTPDQLVKIYNDEKLLFQDNAKATLYGSYDSVTALAYDEDTQQLHVGTSSGRSVFQGLRRIDNTTAAVSASISASNGLVAEQ